MKKHIIVVSALALMMPITAFAYGDFKNSVGFSQLCRTGVYTIYKGSYGHGLFTISCKAIMARHNEVSNTPTPTPVPTVPPVVVPPAPTPIPPTPPVTPVPTPTPTPLPTPPPVVNTEKVSQMYTTGYSFWDNTPPGTADISNPVIHSKAGGTGTFTDPITVAVGHSITNGKDTLDYPKGTKFYAPFLRKYFIVEDSCGDGNSPQNGPCHTGYQGKPWIDFYVDGQLNKSVSNSCMNAITGVHTIITNPSANHPVVAGVISGNSCATNYGETVI